VAITPPDDIPDTDILLGSALKFATISVIRQQNNTNPKINIA